MILPRPQWVNLTIWNVGIKQKQSINEGWGDIDRTFNIDDTTFWQYDAGSYLMRYKINKYILGQLQLSK